ncbi:hypothetical protein HUT18_20950 [Streptomyces sp. NA04227]|uniref:hypothetical protein n=1 Tax=Streptomyces sp. NA04227 TaxID=2742136 RepID=UPI001590AFE3|nr:hypothetical protein [Streptomyces sp. NA04227]QKW08468.1 hypothetical protein HUT18_20950 [Streptomyces sp. NA04227]
MTTLLRGTRTVVSLGLVSLVLLYPATAAGAKDGFPPPPPPGTGGGGSSGNGSIGAQVEYQTNFTGGPGASQMDTSSGPWKPPLCWAQPKFTPDEYKEYKKKTAPIDPSTGKVLPGWDKGTEFHEGDDGAWWFNTYAVDQLKSGKIEFQDLKKCTTIPNVQWRKAGDPPPDMISPLALAGLAFAETKLPAPGVELSPTPDKQVVNLPTKVKFDAPLPRVWVTATFNHFDVNIAATTVATPVSLQIDAGTDAADPRSCTYDLAKSKTGFQVNTRDSGCNVTYRRSSRDGEFPLQAQVKWKVTWTDSADPDGAPQAPELPQGVSTFEQNVAVKEIQSINR